MAATAAPTICVPDLWWTCMMRGAQSSVLVLAGVGGIMSHGTTGTGCAACCVALGTCAATAAAAAAASASAASAAATRSASAATAASVSASASSLSGSRLRCSPPTACRSTVHASL
eukprot:scaffold64529_cov74-Phaeocystis_antarctica.AAC.5